ncbi:MAG: P1 family peptidase [Ignavibacteriales bacterium]|nr:P1 family peptidase [Ignavibacteriales bacterium]
MKIVLFISLILTSMTHAQERPRLRELGVTIGIFDPGPLNAITDVHDVRVGHVTLTRGDSVRTGITAVVPHGGNLFTRRVTAAMEIGNGFGKLIGYTQVAELGQIETPIVLTNTLSVWDAANAIVDYMLGIPENSDVRSINPVVGETNDGFLNDIRGRHVSQTDVMMAIRSAASGPVSEGSVGAGTGTVCFGWKGGIGSSSRRLTATLGGHTLGVLVQTNYGGVLDVAGVPVGKELRRHSFRSEMESSADGSCMIVVATDAPLTVHQTQRLAKRATLALGRTGSAMSHHSGDYSIAFSTTNPTGVSDGELSALFQAVVEATEEAIINSLLKATNTEGYKGRAVKAVPMESMLELLKKYGRISAKDGK